MFHADETTIQYDHFMDEYEDALRAVESKPNPKPEWRHERIFNMGDIGEPQREIEFEPIPEHAPVEEPAEPAKVPAQPEKVPA